MAETNAFAPGATLVVHWEANRRSSTPNAVKSNKTDQGKSKKIILPVPTADAVQPRPGEIWVCRVDRVSSQSSQTHGAILVVPITRKIDYQFAGVWVDPLKAQLIATVLQDPRRNLMLEGDQGVGKSTIARAIADTLGWEYRKISGGLIKKFVFMLGRYVPTSDGSSLNFAWTDSKLVESLREANSRPHLTFLIMLDEFTRIDEDSRDALLDVIEGKERVLRLQTGEEVPVGKNVVFMAAGNVGSGFTVRREDAAARDRWEIVKVTVMPQDEELKHCLRLYPACSKSLMNDALTVINHVREARKDPKMRLSKIPSTRRSEAVAMYLAAGFSIEAALETAVVNQYSNADEAERVANLVKEQLEK